MKDDIKEESVLNKLFRVQLWKKTKNMSVKKQAARVLRSVTAPVFNFHKLIETIESTPVGETYDIMDVSQTIIDFIKENENNKY